MQVSNLTTRVIVAAVGIPLVVLVAMAGGYWFCGFVALVSTLALREYYAMARAKGASPQVITGVAFGLAFTAVFLYNRLSFSLLSRLDAVGISIPLPSEFQLLLILVLLFMPTVLLVELFRNLPSPVVNIATTILGVFYISLFFGSLVGIRELFIPADFPVYAHFSVNGPSVPQPIQDTIYAWGGATVVAFLATIWMCDTAAYFGGRLLGKHKLMERVSPKKTVEGAVAGFVFAVGTFVLASALFLPYLSTFHALVCGGIVGVFGQLGDLVESLLKRDAGIKDSSALLPGHGGVLDRFDSLVFVSPLLFLYLDFVVF